MDAKQHGRFALSERLGKKVQQDHIASADHHAEPWKPAGSRSAHSSGTLHTLYYAPLTSAHPPPGGSRQHGHTGPHAGSISSEASSSNKENELHSSRIFKPWKRPCTKLLIDQTRPSGRGQSRSSRGSGSGDARGVLKPMNSEKPYIMVQGTHARPQVLSSGSYSTVVTSTFNISDSMLDSNHRCIEASGISDASAALAASPGTSMAGTGGSRNRHHSCSPTSSLQQQLLFGMQGGCTQQHTSPAALRYLFQEPSSSSSSSSSSSIRRCSPEQSSSFQGILQDSGTLGHLQRQQQRQQIATACGQTMLPNSAPEQLQEVARLSSNQPKAVTCCHGRGLTVISSQSYATEAAGDGCNCAQQHQQGRSSQPHSIPLPRSTQSSSQDSRFKAPAAQGMQHNHTSQWPAELVQQVDQHLTGSSHSRVTQAPAGCTDLCLAASVAAQHVRIYLDQQADPFKPRTSQQAQWQRERQAQAQHQSTPTGSACAASMPAAAAPSVSYQQLLHSCASVVHNSNAAYMQMKRYQWQRSNAPLGSPGTSTRPLSRMRTQGCSSPQVFSSVPATPGRMKLVDALRMSSPAASRFPDSPAGIPGLQAVPQFSSQGMNTQPPSSLHRSNSSTSQSSLQAAPPPASPAWSVYLTPAPTAEAGSAQNPVRLGDRSALAVARTGGEHLSKAVQTSPLDYHCSSRHVPEPSPWWRGLQHDACRASPHAQVKPRVLFEVASPASAKSATACSEGVSPAHFPFRCRSTSTDAAATGNCHQDDGSSSLVSCSSAPSIAGSDSDFEQDTYDTRTAHVAAAGLARSPLLDQCPRWSVHNNALAWAVESSYAATVGMRSIEELLYQPTAANGGSNSRRPLQPVVVQQHQQQASSQSSFSGGASVFDRENTSPADALAGLTQLAHKLKVSIDDTAASAIAPVVSKADVGLVVLASPLAGCGRWQRGSNIRMQDV